MSAAPSVLLVEDDIAIATVIRVALEGEGMVLDIVETLAERDRALAIGGYRAVITDVMLPDGNGLTTLDALRDSLGGLPPFIVLSAQNTLDTAVSASERGAFDYLPKPFDLDELVASIRAAVESSDGPRDRLAPQSSDAGVPITILIDGAGGSQFGSYTLDARPSGRCIF